MLKTPQPSATTSNTKTHLKKTTATQKSKPGITRVTLSNGYRAYHHRTDGDNMRPAKQQQKQQKKKVRFVKGDVTVPRRRHTPPSTSTRRRPGHGILRVSHGNGGLDGDGDGQHGEDDGGENRGHGGVEMVETRVKEEEEVEDEALQAAMGEQLGSSEVGRGQKVKGGGFVDRGGVRVWRKQPRFRGSGRVQVLDDPVKDGLWLARSEVDLPSDRWRDGSGVECWPKKEIVGGAEERGLRYDEGERDAVFGIEEVAHEDFCWTVRTFHRRQAKGDVSQGEEQGVGVLGEAVIESAGLTDDGSESGRDDDDDEYDFLGDESLEEADGWIPVMVAEQDEGYDWISLTGSFVMMGGVSEAHK